MKPRMPTVKGPNHPRRSGNPKPGDWRVTPPTAELDRTAVVRTRMPGGVGGEEPRGSPLSRSRSSYLAQPQGGGEQDATDGLASQQ